MEKKKGESSSLVYPRTSRQGSTENDFSKVHNIINCICSHCGQTFIFEIDCGDRTCFHCNGKRRHRIFSRYRPVVGEYENPMFVTLTLRRFTLSRERVRYLRDCFTRLRHRSIWKAKRGIYQIEVGTIDDLNQCNLHLHAIVDSDYMSQQELVKVWKEITVRSYIVDIRRCETHGALRYLTTHMSRRIGESRHAALINDALRGSRLIQSFGPISLPLGINRAVCPKCGDVQSIFSEFDALYHDILSKFE